MVALALGMTGDRETARDLAQEAMLRGYQHWERIESFERPGTWVRRVLINLATDHHRRRGVERRRSAHLDEPSPEVLPDPADERWWAAVRALPDRQRAVVALHYLEDRPIAEVADILGIAEGTVKSSLAKARKKLERSLAAGEEPS